MMKNRILGSIIGQCVGDAIGFLVEGATPDITEAYLDMLSIDTTPLYGTAKFDFGQYTDDSQLARELLRSMIKHNGFYPNDYADRIVKMFASNYIVGRGNTCDNAANNLINGVSWRDSGIGPPSAGNGSAMRAAPVGLYFHRSEEHEEMIDAAKQQSIITHKDPRCIAGSVVVAASVAYLVDVSFLDVNRFIHYLVDLVRNISPIFAAELENLRAWLTLPYDEAVQTIAKCGNPDSDDGWRWISPYVIPTVIWSLYCFLTNSTDYWGAIRTAIQAGGDTDTTAAITGAFSGAYLGIDEIPAAYREVIQDQGGWGYGEFVNLINQIE